MWRLAQLFGFFLEPISPFLTTTPAALLLVTAPLEGSRHWAADALKRQGLAFELVENPAVHFKHVAFDMQNPYHVTPGTVLGKTELIRIEDVMGNLIPMLVSKLKQVLDGWLTLVLFDFGIHALAVFEDHNLWTVFLDIAFQGSKT